MKAIIMAGGEGTRLRPISANMPKPMVELFGRPILEHILELLKKNGVSDACVTLRYLPQMIMDYFGNGEKFGVRLEYSIENDALGTAGGVLNCADFIGSEDFVVISGDCVCDFDLETLVAFHKDKHAEVTLALYSHNVPLEYGLVVTDGDGRIERFLEKPAWDNVLTDQINTGIYIVAPSVLEHIPKEKPYDFGKELFPYLLEEKHALYGLGMEGYWCDIGNSAAYLKCCEDALLGGMKIDLRAKQVRRGVWSNALLPEGCAVTPPAYIGKNVLVERGAKIGPFAIIGESSVIAAGATVCHSVISSAMVKENADITGAVVCRGASIGRGTVLEEGSVIGASSIIGDHCMVAAGAKIWPDRQISAGTTISGIVSHGLLKSGLTFTKPCMMTGELGVTMTADTCLRLGEVSSEYGRVGVGWSGGETARVMADVFGCGVRAAGGEVVNYDGHFLACAAYAGRLFDFPLTVYFEELTHEITIAFFGENGAQLTHESERRFEASAAEPHKALSRVAGSTTVVTGVFEAYVSAAVRQALGTMNTGGTLYVVVTGNGAENRALKTALSRLGCTVTDKKSGLVSFEVVHGGMAFAAVDEEGYRLTEDQLKLIQAAIEFECGVKKLAVPYDAPEAIDGLGRAFNAEVLRVGRDGQSAEELFQRQMVMRDGVIAATRICAWLKSHGERLSERRKQIPKVASITRNISLKSDRGAVMRRLASCCSEMATELSPCLRLNTERGCVYIAPLRDRGGLKIRSESASEEIAEELWVEFERRVRENDKA